MTVEHKNEPEVEVRITGATEGAWMVTLARGATIKGTGPMPEFDFGQPFTWEDVDVLRAMASVWDGMRRTGDCPAEWKYEYVGDTLDPGNLADRIAALLPPRERFDTEDTENVK